MGIKNLLKRIVPPSIAHAIEQNNGDQLFTPKKISALKDPDRINYYKNKYRLKNYHIDFINKVTKRINLKGKKILEIGGSNTPIELALQEIGADKWVCVDLPWTKDLSTHPHYKDVNFFKFKENPLYSVLKVHDYAVYTESADNLPKDFYNKFDVVISNCCFEHVLNFSRVLERVYNALKFNGVLISYFGPIFSSFRGNHVNINDASCNFSLNKENYPRELYHAHLLMNYIELCDYMRKNYVEVVATKYSSLVFNGTYLNRFFYEDYAYMLSVSPFEKTAVFPNSVKKSLDGSKMDILRSKFPGYSRFDVDSIGMQAIKLPPE